MDPRGTAAGRERHSVTAIPEPAGKKKWWVAALWVVRPLLAGTFLYAGAVKLWQEPVSFADSIFAFRLLPVWLVTPLTLILPPFEILTGITLLVGWPKRLGAFCSIVLSAAFLFVLTTAIVRYLPVDCRCFGAGPGWLPLTASQRLWSDVVRDALLVLGALILYRHDAAIEEGGKSR